MAVNPLFTAVSGIQANQNYISTVANNLANVNTLGFKGSRTLFGDVLSENLQVNGPISSQIGLGVSTTATETLFTPGSLQATGQPTDMAIEGNGFFVVNNPLNNEHLFTRAGAFTEDQNGFLVTPTGQHLMGGAPGANAGDPLVELQIPKQVGGVAVTDFSIDSMGNVNGTLADGNSTVLGKISLEKFTNPQGLAKAGENLYRNTAKAGMEYGTYQTAGSNDLGAVRSGYVEQSNVDLGQEFSNMILAQRGLQANARVVTTSDEILQEVVNMKH